MNARERVIGMLNGEKPDRMPCFGANSTVTYDQMEKVQIWDPMNQLRMRTWVMVLEHAFWILQVKILWMENATLWL